MQLKMTKHLFFLALFFACLLPLNSSAAAKEDIKPLPAEKAFQLSTSYVNPNLIMVKWHIAPGYYLYADRIKIAFSPTINAEVQYPKGEAKQDEEHGKYEVYKGDVNIPVSLPAGATPSSISIDYQGCSQDGFCYPPTTKNFMLSAADMSVTTIGDVKNIAHANNHTNSSLETLLTDQNGIRKLLHNQQAGVMLLIFAGLGLLLAFTPCVLPMIPILTSIIVGQKNTPGTGKAFFLSFTYVMGMSITYAFAGMAAASLGSSIQVWLQKPITIIIVSSIFILLALSLFGLYEFRFSTRWQNWVARWSNKHEGGTYIGVFFMGVLATLVVSPCVTAPLVGVLIYIGQTGNLMFGASALFAMGLGMGIPLLLIGMSAGKLLPKSGPWMKAIKEMFGFFMVAMAIWLLSRIISESMTLILFGILFLGAAAFVGIYLPRLVKLRKINRTVGLATGLVGVFLIFNGINMRMVVPISAHKTAHTFIVVHNMSDLNKELSRAQAANQPVLLDFYADWCASCVAMDRKVFSSNTVQQALDNFILLRADLSHNTPDDNEILKRFGVIAPPTVLFFNKSGQEVDSQRIIGELNEDEFLTRVDSFKTASCADKVRC